jgi:hypothetical protein
MKFLISEEEKSRILEMHQNATSRQYLTETPADTIYSDKLLDIVTKVSNHINGEIAKKRATDTTFPDFKVGVIIDNNAKSNNEPDTTYWFKSAGKTIPNVGSPLSLRRMRIDLPNTLKDYAQTIKQSLDNRREGYAQDLDKNLKKLPSYYNTISNLVDAWVASFSPQPATKTPTKQTVKIP